MKQKHSLVIWCIFVVLLGTPSLSTAQVELNKEAFTVEQLLGLMSHAYASCKTYRDSGVVENVFTNTKGERIQLVPFTTVFVRPNRFRFEFNSQITPNKNYRYIVWCSGKEVQSWWDAKPGVVREDSLIMALAKATGVSSGAAFTVPTLLMPEINLGWRLTDLIAAKRVKDAKSGKWECYRIDGKFIDTTKTMKLWIDKQSFLVRRIDSQKDFSNFILDATTTYEPFVDEDITEKMLNFDPPGL